MLKRLEEIKNRLFPLKYHTFREYFLWMLTPSMIMVYVGIIGVHSRFIENIGYYLEQLPIILFGTLLYIYCGSYKPRQWLFKKKGKRYEGKIVKAERVYSVGNCTYYFFIEFKKGRKTLIRRTAGYLGNPYLYLENNRCGVYELMGKFMEVDFNVRKRFPKESVEMTDDLYFPIEKHKMFMPKGKKYV